jgi:hypothetical protein
VNRRPGPRTLLDLVLLMGVPALALSVYLLPAGTRRALSLAYLRPDALSLYASHLVHFRPAHLGTNVAGYLVAAGTGYLLAWAAGRRDRYRGALLSVLVALPPLLSALNVAVPRDRLGYGASGLVMAVAGLVPVFLFCHLRAVRGVDADVVDAPALFLIGLGAAAVAAPLGPPGHAVAAVALLVAVAYGRGIDLRLGALRELPAGHAELVAAGVVVTVGFPVVAFPADPRIAGGVVNLYTHLLGYALAFVPAYLAPGIGTDVLAPGSAAGG